MLGEIYKINYKCSLMFGDLEAIQKLFANFSFTIKKSQKVTWKI